MKKIAIFGGAFNPVHLGHINLALMLDIRVKFNNIILIPSHISPHKDSDSLVSGWDRLAMCSLVAERYPKFSVSDIELRREGKSFTVDTVREISRAHPEDKLYMIVGSDMFLSLESWHSSRELLQLVTVCAAARASGEYDELARKQRKLDTMGVKSVVCEINALPVSSTNIRERLAASLPLEGLVPDYIEEYISEKGLYIKK